MVIIMEFMSIMTYLQIVATNQRLCTYSPKMQVDLVSMGILIHTRQIRTTTAIIGVAAITK